MSTTQSMDEEEFSDSCSSVSIPCVTPPFAGYNGRVSSSIVSSINTRDSPTSETNEEVNSLALRNDGTYDSNVKKSRLDDSVGQSADSQSQPKVSLSSEKVNGEQSGNLSDDEQIDFDEYNANPSLLSNQISKFWMNFVPGSTRPRQKTQNYSFEMIVAAKADDHYDRAEELLNRGIPGAAIVLLNKSIMLHPNCSRYYRLRGDAYMEICDYKSAVINYKKVCAMEFDDEESEKRLALMYYFLGQSLFDSKLYSEALEAFTKAAEICPDVECYNTRTLATLAALNRHSECLALINNRMESNKDNPDVFIMRARIYDMFRNTSLCYYDVASALELNPDHEEAKKMMRAIQNRANDLKKRAVELKLAGKDKEALEKINSAIETYPAAADFHLFSGALHRKQGNFNSAIDQYILAMDKTNHIEEDPIFISANRELLLTYNDFAIECFHKEYYNEAIILLNKALKVEKSEKGFYINRGDCFYRTGELHFALADYTQALELDENDWPIRTRISVIHNEFAVLEYYNRQFAEAEKRFTVAITYNPKISQYYISRSRARFMIDDFNGARMDVLIALHLEPESQTITTVMSRLFPGQSINEILHSHEGKQALKVLQSNIINAATPGQKMNATVAVKLANERGDVVPKDGAIAEKTDDSTENKDNDEQEQEENIDLTPRGRVSCLPRLKNFLEDKEFHIGIIKSKRKVDRGVEKLLSSRPSLEPVGPRLLQQSHELEPVRNVSVQPIVWEYGTSNAVDAKTIAVNPHRKPLHTYYNVNKEDLKFLSN